jgi:hypothetical protein
MLLRIIVHVRIVGQVKELHILEIEVCLLFRFTDGALLKGFS